MGPGGDDRRIVERLPLQEPADGRMLVEPAHERRQPARIGHVVVVAERDPAGRGDPAADVAGVVGPASTRFRMDQEPGETMTPLLGERAGAVGGTVVDEHHLPAAVEVLGGQGGELPAERGAAVADGQHHRHVNRHRRPPGRRAGRPRSLRRRHPAERAGSGPRGGARRRTTAP
jgi:hypothetical protein